MGQGRELSPDDRRAVYLYALERLVAERFPDPEARRRWWRRPQKALGGHTPSEICAPGFDADGPLARDLWDLARRF